MATGNYSSYASPVNMLDGRDLCNGDASITSAGDTHTGPTVRAGILMTCWAARRPTNARDQIKWPLNKWPDCYSCCKDKVRGLPNDPG